jgi:hypothetical protein
MQLVQFTSTLPSGSCSEWPELNVIRSWMFMLQEVFLNRLRIAIQ